MLHWLFDTSEFVPRTECGNWPAWLVQLAVLSNLMIALAYYIIPILLATLYFKKRKNLPKSWMAVLFAGFIFLCGTTHFIDALIFKWPIYRFLIVIDFITGVVSLVTAALLPPVVKYIISLRNVEELESLLAIAEEEKQKRILMEQNVRESNHELANQVQRLQNIIATQGWIAEKQMDLESMKKVITDLRRQYRGPSDQGNENLYKQR
jgi:chemotaxis family two-component system sensor kinase Cph1